MTFSFGHYPYVGDDPAGVELAMTDLGRVASAMGALAGQVEDDTRSIAESWPAGHTGQVAAEDAARIGGALGECHQAFARAGQDLEVLHEVLVASRRKVDQLNDAHRALSGPENVLQFLTDVTFEVRVEVEDAFGVAQARAGFGSVAEIDRAYAQVRAHVVEETSLCNELLSRLTAAGTAPAGSTGFRPTSGVSRYGMSFGLLAGWAGPEVADILAGRRAFPTDPQRVHQAWLALRPDQQKALLKGAPERFGNLNGIPATDRDVANRLVLTKQLGQLAAALKVLGVDPNTTDPADLDRLSPEQGAYLATLSHMTFGEAKQALLLDAQLTRNGKKGAQLLAFVPGAYGGKGRAAIAYGAVDVDHADNVVFCVPGLMSRVGNVNNVASDALHLVAAATLADPKKRTVVVAWQGYDAPNFGQVEFQDKAEAGAKLLAADVNSMRTTHDRPIGMLTVVAHSYGSTTTGLALQREHLDVDQVALIGSPGVGGDARTVADLHLLPSQVFVGSASTDIVTHAPGALGANPAYAGFGAPRIKVEVVGRGSTANFGDHSHYFDAVHKGESLYALAEIASGHGDRLAQEGLLTQPRYLDTVPIGDDDSMLVEVDGEASRTPTTGHDHANDPPSPTTTGLLP